MKKNAKETVADFAMRLLGESPRRDSFLLTRHQLFALAGIAALAPILARELRFFETMMAHSEKPIADLAIRISRLSDTLDAIEEQLKATA